MYQKLLKNDLKHNIVQTLNIALFIMLSVAFLSAAGQLTAQLVTSIHRLFEKAQTPHLLQMHTGDIDEARMQEFVNSHEEIAKYQLLEFWNVDNSYLSINKHSLKDSVYDNGFSTQSKEFDFLLDLSDEQIEPGEGEVYVPLYYYTSGLAKAGDTLEIQMPKDVINSTAAQAKKYGQDSKNYTLDSIPNTTLSLKITGFVRDSQMNSSLSVSRRFIVHEADLQRITSVGKLEYLIEFMLHDTKDASKIETAYNAAGLEANGPPFMSIALFRIVNAFSDGITIMALLLISILVIAISLLCIRLTMLAKLEEDEKEISVLRAIGIEMKVIRKIFFAKYIFISAVASVAGCLLSFVIKIPFLMNMKMFFGEGSFPLLSGMIAVLLSCAVFGIILLSIQKMAQEIRKIQPIRKPKQDSWNNVGLIRHFPREMKLVFGDLLARISVYKTMVIVFVLSIFVIIVPMTMYLTISDASFIRYLGLGNYDVRVDLTQIEGKDEEVSRFMSAMAKDEWVEHFEVYTGKLMDLVNVNQEVEKIWIDLGVQEYFHVQYIAGNAPGNAGEIALSKLKANDLEKKVGDELTVIIENVPTTLRISGIYSDLTNGGKTARAIFEANHSKTIWKIVPIKLRAGIDVNTWIQSYQNDYTFAKFSDVKEYTLQIFGNTISMTRIIAIAAFLAAMLLVLLITFLFMYMLYLKDLSENALLKSLGFTNQFVCRQYLWKTTIVLAFGLVIGYVLAFTVGDFLGANILNLIGVSRVKFIREPIFTLLIAPLSLWLSAMLGTFLGTMRIRNMNVSQQIKEDL